jgi:hypothetical protein
MEWTQLQFIFEAVDVSPDYPNGVKVNYSPYSQEKVIEITDGEKDDPFSFSFREVEVHTHPLPTEDDPHDGMYILTGLPDGSKTFKPQPFVKDSRAKLVSLGKKMIKNYGSTFPGCKREWSDWVDNIAPQSDDACEYNKVRLLVFFIQLYCRRTIS